MSKGTITISKALYLNIGIAHAENKKEIESLTEELQQTREFHVKTILDRDEWKRRAELLRMDNSITEAAHWFEEEK